MFLNITCRLFNYNIQYINAKLPQTRVGRVPKVSRYLQDSGVFQSSLDLYREELENEIQASLLKLQQLA